MRRLGERRLQGGGTATYARGPRLRSMCETDGFMLRQVQCWGFDVGTPPENQPVGTLKIHPLESRHVYKPPIFGVPSWFFGGVSCLRCVVLF